MKRVLLALMLLTVPLAAQEQKSDAPAKPAAPPNQTKVFILKYADPQAIRNLLAIFSAGVAANPEIHALAVTAPQDAMRSIEEAIAKLDVPAAAPKNFDFTVYLVVGTEAENIISAGVPKDLDGVIAQLKGAFAFKNYRLLDVLTVRARGGQTVNTRSSGGSVQLSSVSKQVNSTFSIRSASLVPDGATIRLDRLSCQSKVPIEISPGNYSDETLSLDTDLDIKEGQKVVVGRMGMSSQQAMFVVLTVKVVQ
jgi:hypothetical protein